MKTLAFMASSPIALPTFEALHRSHYTIACLYTQPPKPSGRGQKYQLTPLHQRALELHIPIFTPPHFQDKPTISQFQELNLDCNLVFAYGHILPPAILNAPPFGSLNIHASLLPALRGAAPINRAIEQGLSSTGISLMQMVKELDAGPILAQWKIPLPPDITAPQLTHTIAQLSAQHIVEALDAFFLHQLSPTPQNHTLASYAPKITKDESLINWNHTASSIEKKCRALLPYPACSFLLQQQKIKLLLAQDVSSHSPTHHLPPGTIINHKLFTVACAQGSTLQLISLQRPNKKPAPAKGFLSQFSPSPLSLF